MGCSAQSDRAHPRPALRRRGPGRGLQLGHALPEQRIGDVSDAVFDRVVQPLEFGFRFGRTLAQFGNMRHSALRAFLAAVEYARQDLLETLGLQKALLDMLGYQAVEFFHWNGAALAAGLSLPGLGAQTVCASRVEFDMQSETPRSLRIAIRSRPGMIALSNSS